MSNNQATVPMSLVVNRQLLQPCTRDQHFASSKLFLPIPSPKGILIIYFVSVLINQM